jgi:hypothetical protein
MDVLSREGSNFLSRSISPRLSAADQHSATYERHDAVQTPTHSSIDFDSVVMYTNATMWIANCSSTESST